MNVITPGFANSAIGERKIDASRGTSSGLVSSQWYSRPDDQRFLSLSSLHSAVKRRRERSQEAVTFTGRLRFDGDETNRNSLVIEQPGFGVITPTHHSFTQLCEAMGVGRATSIFRSQPGFLAGINLNWASRQKDAKVKAYVDTEAHSLMAATGPDYGRIYDASVVEAIMRFAGDGVGDTQWKVPGVINWATGSYNPWVDITKETTTLYASDRDLYIFLVDDTNPIEIGKLPNGDPDLIFRGFAIQNSEMGTKSLRIFTMWIRGVCQNRNLWGVEGEIEELRVIHTKHGHDRFAREAEPAMQRYAASEPTVLLAGIKAAKQALVASDKDEAQNFLMADLCGFSKARATAILESFEREEGGRPPETAWDMAMAITAKARTIHHQDARLDMEAIGARVMKKAAQAV